MSSEKLKSDIILTRDRRQGLLESQLASGHPTLLFLSLNIPGAVKNPPGAEQLFSWALGRLAAAFPGLTTMATGCDLLGPYALLGSHCAAVEVKRDCVALETSQAAARLVDADVFDDLGRQIDRAALSLPPRPCLVCELAAVECMRAGRHSYTELGKKIDELLAPFRN
jgi:holo-ACP synthase